MQLVNAVWVLNGGSVRREMRRLLVDGGGEAIPMDDLNGSASAKRRPANGEVTAPPLL